MKLIIKLLLTFLIFVIVVAIMIGAIFLIMYMKLNFFRYAIYLGLGCVVLMLSLLFYGIYKGLGEE